MKITRQWFTTVEVKSTLKGHFHTISDSFSCRLKKLLGTMNSNSRELEQVVLLHRIWCHTNPHSRLSSSAYSLSLRSEWNTCTTVCHRTYPRYATIHFWDRQRAAQLRSATEFAMESPFLYTNWSPIWPAVYDFRRGAKVFRCILSGVNLACTTANINFSCLLFNLNGLEESGRILHKVNTSKNKRKEFKILLY